jgi:hypothetical protein
MSETLQTLVDEARECAGLLLRLKSHPAITRSDTQLLPQELDRAASLLDRLCAAPSAQTAACNDTRSLEMQIGNLPSSPVPDASKAQTDETKAGEPEHRYRHLKTGGTYKVIAHGKLEWSLAPVVIYEAEKDGTIWVRPEAEFFDGRFERIAALSSPTPEGKR